MIQRIENSHQSDDLDSQDDHDPLEALGHEITIPALGSVGSLTCISNVTLMRNLRIFWHCPSWKQNANNKVLRWNGGSVKWDRLEFERRRQK